MSLREWVEFLNNSFLNKGKKQQQQQKKGQWKRKQRGAWAEGILIFTGT